MKELTISEVASRARIRPSAIRYYESVGILPAPRRTNGRRRYDTSVLHQLAVIQLAQEAGFTVAEIGRLFYDFEADTPASERWQTMAAQKLVEVEALIARAQGMKHLLEESLLKCRCLHFEECAQFLSACGASRDV